MKIEELIQMHHESLRRKVSQDPFRPERLKARIREHHKPQTLPLRRTVVLYTLLLAVFTLLNVMVIGGLRQKRVSSDRQNPVEIVSTESLASHLTAAPGSISLAYEEVMK